MPLRITGMHDGMGWHCQVEKRVKDQGGTLGVSLDVIDGSDLWHHVCTWVWNSHYWKRTSHPQDSLAVIWISHLITLKVHGCSLPAEDVIRNEFARSQTAYHLLAIYLLTHNPRASGEPKIALRCQYYRTISKQPPTGKATVLCLLCTCWMAWCGLHFVLAGLGAELPGSNGLWLVSCWVSSYAVYFPWLCHLLSFHNVMGKHGRVWMEKWGIALTPGRAGLTSQILTRPQLCPQ